jgi:hypothetical protein
VRRGRLERLVLPFGVQSGVQLLEGEDVGEVALVVLEDHRDVLDGEADLGEVLAEVVRSVSVSSETISPRAVGAVRP